MADYSYGVTTFTYGVNALKRLVLIHENAPMSGAKFGAKALERCQETPPFERPLPPTQLRELANDVVVRNEKAVKKSVGKRRRGCAANSQQQTHSVRKELSASLLPEWFGQEDRVTVSVVTPVVLPQSVETPVETSLLLTREGPFRTL